MLLLLVLFSSLTFVVSENCPPKPENTSHHFVYEESTVTAPGPSHWKNIWENCGGSRQSPINIDTSSVSEGDFPTLKITFDKPKGLVVGTLINTGHYPKLEIDKDNGTAKITGGPLDSTYTLEQFHVHFGCENDRGCEHTLDNKRFSGQLHLVFVDSKSNNTVVALWLKASDKGNKILERFTKKLSHIIYPGNTTNVTKSHKIHLIDLIPHKKYPHYGKDNGGGRDNGGPRDNGNENNGNSGNSGNNGNNGNNGNIGNNGRNGNNGNSDNGHNGEKGGNGSVSKKVIILADYYHYHGSLTTPPCCENVMWFVMKQKVPISNSQLGRFRDLKTGEPNDFKDV